MAVLTGSGTLYDADENELGSVAYRIDHDADPDAPILAWSGEVNFDTTPDVPLEPGRYLLETGDGTRAEVEIAPSGAGSGAAGQLPFTGVGVLGADGG
ncbi:MAG: hypothetical protein AVDCRST_MAG19-4009 [uncultured Thermomicrobiales bacterium]|uniref:Uncharacterized protein n=1 Tax=uncultured Thermomicrobiales bacterium TaxID=1645740 RepID=A0A6J4VS17_9BACT|nr:MAG: hypothetical protein AVDCRST_MAG19-4009 [uncultured Thermomicrobiales bacterium]